ncbi:hypothetical protein LOD99_9618 [Oopsacas minuta]|uniref:Uncharacterized protein n=1 Tax=Oopsacas minuta TaxID=111878 RepID=A0AAV7KLD9_9METZ|nr:hypothetical protein LOD99_9618 [Oopsacas minuta]
MATNESKNAQSTHILKKPWGIAVAEDHILVTDFDLNALFQIGDFKLARTGTKGSGAGELNYLYSLGIDYNKDVYIADSSNNRVCISLKNSNSQLFGYSTARLP